MALTRGLKRSSKFETTKHAGLRFRVWLTEASANRLVLAKR